MQALEAQVQSLQDSVEMLLQHHRETQSGSAPPPAASPLASWPLSPALGPHQPSSPSPDENDDDEDPLAAAAMMAPLRHMLTAVETARLQADTNCSPQKRHSHKRARLDDSAGHHQAPSTPSPLTEDPVELGLFSEATGRRLFDL